MVLHDASAAVKHVRDIGFLSFFASTGMLEISAIEVPELLMYSCPRVGARLSQSTAWPSKSCERD